MAKIESGTPICPTCGYTPTAYQHVAGCAYTPTAGLPEARPEPTSELVARLFAARDAALAAPRERDKPPAAAPPEAPNVTPRRGGRRPVAEPSAATLRQRARRERLAREAGEGG